MQSRVPIKILTAMSSKKVSEGILTMVFFSFIILYILYSFNCNFKVLEINYYKAKV